MSEGFDNGDHAPLALLETALKAATRGRHGLAVRAFAAARARGLEQCIEPAVLQSLQGSIGTCRRLAFADARSFKTRSPDASRARPLAAPSAASLPPLAPARGAPEAGRRLSKPRLPARCFRVRHLLAGLPLLFALVSTRGEFEHDVVAWTLAALVAAAGVALRAWATLHRPSGPGDTRSFSAGGPYARVRNPLALANLLILGAAYFASELLWFLPLGIGWAFLVYHGALRYEEQQLLTRFGPAYEAYCELVPRWIPLSGGTWPSAAWLLRPALAQSRVLIMLTPFMLKEWNLLHLWPSG